MNHPVKVWSFYEPSTGTFTGRTFAGHESILQLNTPDGHKAIEGSHDSLSRRVNAQTGEVEDWRPDRPSTDHEWDQESRRWRVRADVAQRQESRAAALAEIEALERSQARPVRELALDSGNAAATQRLAEIEAQIARLRGCVRAEEDAGRALR